MLVGLKEIITSANNVLDRTNDLMGVANSVLDKTNNIRDSVDDVRKHYRNGQKYYNSEQAKEDFAKADKYRRKSDFVAGLTIVLWLVFIIGTIVLCVTGNDIVLKLLHL